MAFRFEDTGTQTAHGLTLNTFSAESAGALNSYANVTAILGNQIVINRNDILYGAYEEFDVGVDILFHVSASAATTYKTYLGCYCVATITAVEDSVLTLDKDVTQILPADEFGRYQVQVVTIARFGNLTLNSGVSIVPPAYSTTHFYGGIVAIKCFGNLTFAGGHINLVDRGLPVSATSMRPKTSQEEQGTLDTDTYSGWENSQTHERFLLNCGDGAAFILVRGTMNISNTASRIGNPSTNGAQFCRGASDSVGDKPDNVTNIGGSTILIAAKKIDNFNPAIIAKYRAANSAVGKGICRCYIASESKLRNDEGLYAYDCISDPTRLLRELNIRNFGNGSHGVGTDADKHNNYARVVAISSDRKRVTYVDKTTDGVAQITKGALVMIHATHRETPPDEGNEIAENTGTFRLANVLEDNGSVLTLDSPTIDLDPVTYAIQVIAIPQYSSIGTNLTPNIVTSNFDGDKGGIVAIAVSGLADKTRLYFGSLDAARFHYSKQKPYGRGGLRYIGNSQMQNRLPIGEGLPSIFLLAKELTTSLTASSGFGHFYTTGADRKVTNRTGSIYQKVDTVSAKGGGYKGVTNITPPRPDAVASGAGGAKTYQYKTEYISEHEWFGGYGSNGYGLRDDVQLEPFHLNACTYGCGGKQGAHVFIVADKIINFTQELIRTGGLQPNGGTNLYPTDFYGGAGYGGGAYTRNADNTYVISGGGYNGGGSFDWKPSHYLKSNQLHAMPDRPHSGGSSGWCFVYCNHAIEQKPEGTVLFD